MLLGVRDHLLLGEIRGRRVLLGEPAHDFANPEDVADPQVAFGRLRRGELSPERDRSGRGRGGETGHREKRRQQGGSDERT